MLRETPTRLLERFASAPILRAPPTGFFWLLAGNLTHALSAWGLLVVVARLGEPAQVGEWALALALVTPVFTLSHLNLRALLISDVRGDTGFPSYLRLRLLTTGLALLVTVLSTFFFEKLSSLLIAVAVARTGESLGDIFQAHHHRIGHPNRAGQFLALRGSLTIAVGSVAFQASGNLDSLAWSLAAASLGVLVLWESPTARRARPGNVRRPPGYLPALPRLAAQGFPLGVVTALISLYSFLPRMFLEYYHGPAELGLFAAAAQWKMAGILLVSSLGQAATPRLAAVFSEGSPRQWLRLTGALAGRVAAIGGAGIMTAVLLGEELLSRVYGPPYGDQPEMLVWLMLAAALEYLASILGFALTAARFLRLQVPVASATLACLGLALGAWTPAHGGVGAAQALTAAMALQLVLLAPCLALVLNRRRHRANALHGIANATVARTSLKRLCGRADGKVPG